MSSTETLTEWRMHADCRSDEDPDAWHLGEHGWSAAAKLTYRRALRVCQGCPVRRDCRDFYTALPPALRQNIIAGGVVWDRHGQPGRLVA